jgi:hypothetical protein
MAPPSDPRLGRFNPLGRILTFDDFDDGFNGWCALIANHDGNLDRLRPAMADLRPPQISNCTFFDIGTHGAVDGTYALKLATRPKPFSTSTAIKRLTYQRPGLVQVETYFTYKAEQVFGEARGAAVWDGNIAPSERQFGDFTISNDICDGERGVRFHCALRYANTDGQGNLLQTWVYKTSLHTTTKMHEKGLTQQTEDYHVVKADDWKAIPGGRQPLCFNETATKINWHYLRWLFSTKERRNVELQVNDLTLDLRSVPVLLYDHAYTGLNHLLNFVFDVRTRVAARNYLFLDSVLISVDW